MSLSSVDSLKIRAKLYQKSKRKLGLEVPLKDALKVIAKNSGFSSWKELKDAFELADLLNPPRWSAQWKIWYSSKEEARKHLTRDKFLLPYLNQAFICDVHYISALGLEVNELDLIMTGNDWTNPLDKKAFHRLLVKIRHHFSK